MSSLEGGFDPRSVIGKRVHFEILLDWDLQIPVGVIKGVLPAEMTRGQVHYVVELDSEMTFEPHRKGLLLRRRPNITVKQVVLAMRNSNEIAEELHGQVSSELSAPLLDGVTGQISSLEYPDKRGDLEPIGPVRVLLIE